MDNDYTQTGAEKSAEEVSWDKEFSSPTESAANNIGSTLADLGQLLVQVPAAIISMSNVMFPEDTRRHARAAARESFLTVRSLLAAVGDGIEGLLAEPSESDSGSKPKATVSGPAGTWGTARAGGGASGSTAGNKSRRIEISDTEDSSTNDSADNGDVPEDRGLRADIDY